MPRWLKSVDFNQLLVEEEHLFKTSCIGSAGGLQLCRISDSIVIEQGYTYLVEIHFNQSVFDEPFSSCVNLREIGFCLNSMQDEASIRKGSFFGRLDSHYCKALDIKRRFKDLRNFNILINENWIYFYLEQTQIHMMEYPTDSGTISFGLVGKESDFANIRIKKGRLK